MIRAGRVQSMRVGVALIAAFLVGTVSAEPEAWMKRAKPNELPVFLLPDDSCPADASAVWETVEGVLVRARIKPIMFYDKDDPTTYPMLSVTVSCDDKTSAIDVDFLGQDAGGYPFRFGVYSPYSRHGSHGGDAEFFL